MKDIEDEIPFAVPEGWAWCRLPNLCKIPITDGTHQTPTYSDKENGIPFLSSKDVTSRKIDWNKIKYITKELHEELQKRIQPCRNDILLAKNGTTGVAALVDTDKIFDIYVTLAVLRPAEVVHPNYLHYVINSPFCKKQFNGHLTGIGVPNLHLNDICKTIIPLPPLSEQQRIVAKIETIFAQIDLLEQNKADLQTAIKQAKSKILDLAIRGKLVQQDPADEPASVMLEKLRAEKEAKIASGEMKRGKNDSYIYRNPTDNCYYQKYADGCEENISDEIPFDVPDGWAWCRLGEISSELGDGIHGTPEYKQNGSCYFINGNNLSNGKITIKEETKTVGEEQYRRYKKNLSSKTMFVSINGTLGSIAFYNNEHIVLGKSVCYFNLVNERLKYFLYFLLNSQYFQKYAKAVATGSTIKNVSLKAMSCFLIPLPSFVEQQRIVTKIEELFAQFDSIIAALAD